MATGTISTRLRELRQQRGLSTYELADIIGCSEPTIVQWENGRYSPSIRYLAPLQQWFINAKDSKQNTNISKQKINTQHPAKDGNYMLVIATLERCAIVKGGCECEYKHGCEMLLNAMADRCCDRPLSAVEYIEFIFKFVGMQTMGDAKK